MQVGRHIPIDINTPRNYRGATQAEQESVWNYTLSHPGATYIAIHFVDFDLGGDDYLIVSNFNGEQSYVLQGKGKMGAGTFWAQHIKGDSVFLELIATSGGGGRGFEIDEYVAGDVNLVGVEAICGADDKRNAVCYQISHPTEYQRGRAVARLLINGSGLCTGWLVSQNNHLITNEHCITSSQDALNTDYEFMAEAPNCGNTNCQMCYPGVVFSGALLVQDDPALDYALVQINSGNPAPTYGYLEIDNRAPVVGEQIYIPQHPDGRAKEFSIISSDPHDAGSVCRVFSTNEPACQGNGPDVGYYADTEGGSSGSPVLATSSHRVIALHHCAGCPNTGVPINLIYSQIRNLLGQPSNSPPSLSNPRVVPIAGTTSTNFEFLVDYYDADGDPPHSDWRKVYISGDREGNMTLKTGTASNGTYRYETTLPCGSYYYWFFFADTKFASDSTPVQYGPYVCTSVVELKVEVSGGPVTNNIEVEFCHGPDFPPSQCQRWGATQLSQIVEVNPNQQLTFSAGVDCESHEFIEWILRDDNGNVVTQSDDSWLGFHLGSGNLHATAYFSYNTQINYTIEGTVLRSDNSPVPGGVDLTLTSPVQTKPQHTDNGNFLFTGVNGGVPVTITASANGYQFSPPKLFYDNLHSDKTDQGIIAYAADNYAPTISFIIVPPAVSESSNICFSWIGEDNVSPPANILYKYKLNGVDADWSAWSSSTSKCYDVANRAYTFWVTAKDEAVNENYDPISYKFVVNAKPKLTSAIRINNSVWASRISVQMPPGATTFGTQFILLPQHSGTNDPEIVPVKIHRAGNPAACGANEIIASQVGLPPRITKAGTGYLLALPDSLWAGESAQYDIVWGKIKYFGWQEVTNVPRGFPNVPSGFDLPYLDDQLRLWRSAKKDVDHGYLEDGWLFMDMCTESTILIPETVIRFVPGEWLGGNARTSTEFYYPRFLKVGSNICYLWGDERYEYHDPGDYTYRRFGVQLFNSQGSTLCSVDGQYVLDAWFNNPNKIIDNRLWIVVEQNTSSRGDIWFFVIDQCGNEIIPKTIFDTIQKNSSREDFYGVYTLGENVLLLWERSWETAEGDDRQEICYQVRNKNGGLVKATTVINPPLLADTVEKDDEYDFESALSNNEGKVWISYEHTQSGQPWEWYYIIIGPNGNIWKGPIQTSSERDFHFCDKDGYIWAGEGVEFFALNPDDIIAFGPRAFAFIPNQTVGNIAASVGVDGYRFYDRWSPQPVGIDVPGCANISSMELFDLNLWANDLHPANVMLKEGDTIIWSQSGQFTGHTTVDISGTLNCGPNLLRMTQNDFLGGQVLVTFPYSIPSPKPDINCDCKVNCEDLKILAEQWLQQPGTPSADIAPTPVDGKVNFLDFAALAEDWLK